MSGHEYVYVIEDLNPHGMGDDSYDGVDYLIDTDPITLGRRYRAALLEIRQRDAARDE